MSDPGARPRPDRGPLRTDRLWLDRPSQADVDDLWAIHGDPATWTHFPQGVHTDRSQSTAMVAESARQFAAHGLGYWSVRDVRGGPVIGRGGCAVPDELPWWNLYYRFATSAQGHGYAVELGRVAVGAAHDVAPDRPVIAFLLEHNVASRRTAERIGLRLVWRGPDLGNDDPDAVRLVFCDRDPSPELLATIEEKFRSP